MTEFLYEPGLSPLSEVLDLDQSEVEPCDRLWPGESSSESPPVIVGVKMDMGLLEPFLSGVRLRVLGWSSRVSSSEKSVDPSSWERFQSMLTFSNMVFLRARA